ncbi:MAG TPA: polyketide cyclase [Rhodanobacter sp.]|nr:polyketide cyclase [Rhodanobacter sp.]
MMRVLEFLVALLIVAGVGVVAGVASPGSGHVDRSLTVGKDLRQVYDVLDNFRRFPDYAVLRGQDRGIQFKLSGKAFGPGAEVSWISTAPKIGDGGLTIASATPEFDKVDTTTPEATIVWSLDNRWRGMDKHFTLSMKRQGSRGQLTDINWAYDVKYGWNLVDRFSNLYIHGEPDSFIQGGLGNLQNVLAAIPNVDYSKMIPAIEQTQPQPVLLIPTSIQRKDGIDGLDDAINKAVTELNAAAKQLGVKVTGSRIVITTNYGDQTYTFDVALPIDSSTLTVNGQSQQLVAATQPTLDTSGASDDATATADAAAAKAAPGSHDRFGRLIVGNGVRATLAFGGPALKGMWSGTFAGVPLTRDMLKAYSQTHGYRFDDIVNRSYDTVVTPEVKDVSGAITTYAKYAVYLPLSDAPEQTPEQAAGMQPQTLDTEPAPAGTAPAPAGSAPAPASSAPATTASTGA